MKKISLITLTTLALILTACGAASTTPRADSTNPGRTLPVTTQLIIGIFKLEDTDQAVTAEQAKELLPLWQVYSTLLTSDSGAQEEKDALVEQIQETMTSNQMQAINEMNLTQQDVLMVMQEQGIEFGAAQQRNPSNSTQNNGGGLPAGGPPDELIAGSGPGGGLGAGSGQGLSPEQIATVQARRAENGGEGFGNLSTTPALLTQAMIQWLQEKAGS